MTSSARRAPQPARPRLPARSHAAHAAPRPASRRDPGEFGQGEFDQFVAGTAAGSLLLFLLPLFEVGFVGDLVLSTVFGGGALAYAQLRKDEVGNYAGQVGSYSMKAVDKVQELDREYKVTEQVKSKVDGIVKDIKSSL